MNWHEDVAGDSPELKQALKHFKASMDAWSYAVSTDATVSRPRTVEVTAQRRSWRLASGWALGCLLAAGSLTAAVHHRQAMARQTAQAAAQEAAQKRAAAERISAQAQNRAPAAAAVKQEAVVRDEDLLASVDQDVSQQVPAAMEPLAQLMDESGAQ